MAGVPRPELPALSSCRTRRIDREAMNQEWGYDSRNVYVDLGAKRQTAEESTGIADQNQGDFGFSGADRVDLHERNQVRDK